LLAYKLSRNGADAPVLDGLTGEQRVFFFRLGPGVADQIP